MSREFCDFSGPALRITDKAFAARCLAGETDAVRKFTRLDEVAFAGEQVPRRRKAGIQ